MKRNYENMSAYELIKAGLQEALRHARGEMALKTTKRVIPDQERPVSSSV
jgi:hypothetical protein